MSDAYQGPAIVADLHSRKQHRFHCFQQSTTFHSDFSDGDSQTITELPGKYIVWQISHFFIFVALTVRYRFKENLKDVEEKRLVTDSKYLALLGLDGQTSTTPISLKPQNVTVVSLVRPGNEQYIYGFVRNISHFLPNNSIVIYSVGLNEDSLQNIRLACNSTRCNVIHFDLSPFPAHVEDDTLHVYRPLVIQVSNNFYNAFIVFQKNCID